LQYFFSLGFVTSLFSAILLAKSKLNPSFRLVKVTTKSSYFILSSYTGGRVGGRKAGRLEGWKAGRLEGWKAGRQEGRKAGRQEERQEGRKAESNIRPEGTVQKKKGQVSISTGPVLQVKIVAPTLTY
jgi:predicted transposase YdaD